MANFSRFALLIVAFGLARPLFAPDGFGGYAQYQPFFSTTPIFDTRAGRELANAQTARIDGRLPDAQALWKKNAEASLAKKHYQEAIWLFRQAGESARADAIERRLLAELTSVPLEPDGTLGKGAHRWPVYKTPDGVRVIYRQGNSSELAAYDFDRLLGLNKVPLSVLRQIGDTRGSLQLVVERAKDANQARLSNRRQSGDLGFLWWVGEQGDPREDNWMVHEGNNDFSVDHEKLFHFWNKLSPEVRVPRYEVYRRLKAMTKAEFEEGTPSVRSREDLWRRCQLAIKLIDAEIEKHGVEKVFALPDWSSFPSPSASVKRSETGNIPSGTEVFLPEREIGKVIANRAGLNWVLARHGGLLAYPSEKLGVSVDQLGAFRVGQRVLTDYDGTPKAIERLFSNGVAFSQSGYDLVSSLKAETHGCGPDLAKLSKPPPTPAGQ